MDTSSLKIVEKTYYTRFFCDRSILDYHSFSDSGAHVCADSTSPTLLPALAPVKSPQIFPCDTTTTLTLHTLLYGNIELKSVQEQAIRRLVINFASELASSDMSKASLQLQDSITFGKVLCLWKLKLKEVKKAIWEKESAVLDKYIGKDSRQIYMKLARYNAVEKYYGLGMTRLNRLASIVGKPMKAKDQLGDFLEQHKLPVELSTEADKVQFDTRVSVIRVRQKFADNGIVVTDEMALKLVEKKKKIDKSILSVASKVQENGGSIDSYLEKLLLEDNEGITDFDAPVKLDSINNATSRLTQILEQHIELGEYPDNVSEKHLDELLLMVELYRIGLRESHIAPGVKVQ